jgi:hypothetical protein
MQNSNKFSKGDVISTLKEWVAPALISIVGMLVWRDVTEMRADVKLLLTQQSADRVKIEQLEKDVDILKNYMFVERRKTGNEEPGVPKPTKQYEFYPVVLQREDHSKSPIKKHKITL